MSASLLLLILVLGVVWFWHDSLRAHELARASAFDICNHQNMQLLDATVSLSGLRLARNDLGRVVLLRTYAFEYSGDGDSRSTGFVVLRGRCLESVGL